MVAVESKETTTQQLDAYRKNMENLENLVFSLLEFCCATIK